MASIPFGKYKDIDIEKVPEDYLLWFWDNVPKPYWQEIVGQELERRDGIPRKLPDRPTVPIVVSTTELGKGSKVKVKERKKHKPKPMKKHAMSAADFLQLPENIDDYGICMMGNVQEMAEAAERIRERWESSGV